MDDNLVSLILLATGFGLGLLARRWSARRRGAAITPIAGSSDLGYAVEVDCRACGQFNRVPSHRLRDRPSCGRCKARLMPGKRVVLCRVSPMEGLLRTELDALWRDEDRLWQCLADHVAIEAKARADARDPQHKVVN